MFLEMADDGLNGGTPFELALDLRREAALPVDSRRFTTVVKDGPMPSGAQKGEHRGGRKLARRQGGEGRGH